MAPAIIKRIYDSQGNIIEIAKYSDAGPDQQVWVGETVTLDGAGFSGADNDTLTYTWTITAKQGGGGLVGETVRLLNGNMIETRSDLSIASPNSFGLSLSAVYNSRSNIKGVMGHGWRHSYEAELHTNITIGSH